MAKFQDLSGQKFNRLTVIRRDESVLNKVSWICKCECGNEISVTTSHLKCGHTQSCGCLQKEKAREANFLDLTGQRFGRLTVIKEADKYISPQGLKFVQWLCKCDCGNDTIVLATNLKKGTTKSCGCLVKEICATSLIKDLTGLKFGMLTVLERADNKTYSSGINRVAWKCKCDCGNEKIVLSSLLISGETKSCGCMASSGEYNLIIYFLNNNVNYEYQKRFEDCRGIGNKPLSYDFYLPNHNMLIECQGEQHERPIEYFGGEEQFAIQQEHDKRKREYAKDNGYRLLEISYKDYNNIDNILTKAIN